MSTQTTPPITPTDDPPPRMNEALLGILDKIKTLSNLGVAKAKSNPAQGKIIGWQ